LRRLEARDQALRALRARDHTVASLEQRLADRGASPGVRRETIEAAQRAGLVNDRRYAHDRSTLLAGRGAGDHLIAADLEQRGVPEVDIREALDLLEPESHRAARIIAARGRTPRTARHLAVKGFSEETLETLVADLAADALD
jgi:regulatory protein